MAGHMNSNLSLVTLIVTVVCVLLLLVVIGGIARPDLVRCLVARLLRRDASAAAANVCTNEQHCCACPQHAKNSETRASAEAGAKNGAKNGAENGLKNSAQNGLKNSTENGKEEIPLLDMAQKEGH
jgi:hypothetical protein